MKIKERKIAELIPAEYNPRGLTDKERTDLRGSLERFGIVDPVIVNTHPERLNIIVGGHQRCLVWESMGNKTIPTTEVKLSVEHEKELNIRLNKNSGHWDWDLLNEYFDGATLQEWGFEDYELDTDSTVNLDDFFAEGEQDDKAVTEKIILEYSSEDFEKVTEKLNGITGSREQIIWDLLGL